MPDLFQLEALEPRPLLSADPVAVAAPAATPMVAIHKLVYEPTDKVFGGWQLIPQAATISADVAGDEVTFPSDSDGPDLYLTSLDGSLQWSDDGADWQDTGISITDGTDITVKATSGSIGTVHLDDLWVVGADLTVKATHIVITDNSIISTRDIAADFAEIATAESAGPSGNLALFADSPQNDRNTYIGAGPESAIYTHDSDGDASTGELRLEARRTGRTNPRTGLRRTHGRKN